MNSNKKNETELSVFDEKFISFVKKQVLKENIFYRIISFIVISTFVGILGLILAELQKKIQQPCINYNCCNICTNFHVRYCSNYIFY